MGDKNEHVSAINALTERIMSTKSVTQSQMDIISDIVSKHLLSDWCNGYNKLKLKLGDGTQDIIEFIPPPINKEFVQRYVNGHETMSAHLHKNPTIQIKINRSVFNKLTKPDQVSNLLKSAIKYYDIGAEKSADYLLGEVGKLGTTMKHLVGTTKLYMIVSCPLSMIFSFDGININNPDKIFNVKPNERKAISEFISNIATGYDSPEKDKNKIVTDMQAVVKSLNENCDYDVVTEFYELPSILNEFYNNGFDKIIDDTCNAIMTECVDTNYTSKENKTLLEKFGVKKLRKIPSGIAAYISIEAEAIDSPNSKMILASYCLSKIEIVEWYIELLHTGSQKYIVPHTMSQLQRFRTDLLAAYNKILAVKVTPRNMRPIISIDYPNGYEKY